MPQINSMIDFSKQSNNETCVFVRSLGINDSFFEDLIFLDQNNSETTIYKRYSQLPKLFTVEDSDFYTTCYDTWQKSRCRIGVTKNITATHALASVLGKCLAKTVAEFSKLSTPNQTIEKNFVSKLLFRFDSLISSQILQASSNTTVKIVCENITKKQDYLFFYLLSLMGYHVLLLQTKEDIGEAENNLSLSTKILLGDFSATIIPTFIARSPSLIPQQKPIDITHPTRKSSSPATISSTAIPSAKSYEELAILASSVVQITNYDDTGEVSGTGSGIMIGKEGYILTNFHVVAGGTKFTVRLENDDVIYETNQIIKYHNLYDLAILRIGRQLNPIPIYKGAKEIVRGQKVVAIGSPLGLFNTVSDGIISGFRVINDVNMIQFTAPISAGSSGGALLNINGEIIGISTAGMNNGQNLNLAVDYKYINDFIAGFIR